MASHESPRQEGSGLVIDRAEALRQIREANKGVGIDKDPIDLDMEQLDRWATYWETWQAKSNLSGDPKLLIQRQKSAALSFGTGRYEMERRIDVVRWLLFHRNWPK